MFNKFTNKSQEAIINAQIIAQDNGQQQIEALHVFVALITQSESLIKPIFEKFKISVDAVEDEVFSLIEKLPKTAADSPVGTVQGTAEVAMILERAKKEADKKKDEYISTEHILLALIDLKSSAQDILVRLGVEYKEVLKILKDLRGAQTVDSTNPKSK